MRGPLKWEDRSTYEAELEDADGNVLGEIERQNVQHERPSYADQGTPFWVGRVMVDGELQPLTGRWGTKEFAKRAVLNAL